MPPPPSTVQEEEGGPGHRGDSSTANPTEPQLPTASNRRHATHTTCSPTTNLTTQPLPSSTTGAAAATHPASSSAHREGIEMNALKPTRHRRRRSTLTSSGDTISTTNSNNSLASKIATRARSLQGLKGPAGGAGPLSTTSPSSSAAGDSKEMSSESDNNSYLSDEDLHDDEETGLAGKDRRRKRSRRRRNARLDNRVAGEAIAAEEQKVLDREMLQRLAINALLIGLWYLFSLSISLYNKWMFDSERLNFAFPLFTTSMHMVVQFCLSSLVLYLVPSLRPSSVKHSSNLGRSRHEAEPDRPPMTKIFYLTRIGPCGAATGLDIGLGNTSLKLITLTFYTMCKSSSLAFVLIFAFIFRLESPTWRLVAVIATMTVGVVMMVAGEVEFKLGGFLLVITAAFFSGFRWALTQILLLRNPATSNPFSSIFFLAPIMFVTLICIAIPVEGLFELLDGLQKLSDDWGPFRTPLLLLFPGTLAFLMTASEFALLQRTSVVTLSIAGIFKEVVTITVAALVFDDKLTPINVSGLIITIGAIAAYNWIKISQMRSDGREKVALNGGHVDEISGSDGDEEENALLGHDCSEAMLEHDSLVTLEGDLIPNPRASRDERESRTSRSYAEHDD